MGIVLLVLVVVVVGITLVVPRSPRSDDQRSIVRHNQVLSELGDAVAEGGRPLPLVSPLAARPTIVTPPQPKPKPPAPRVTAQPLAPRPARRRPRPRVAATLSGLAVVLGLGVLVVRTTGSTGDAVVASRAASSTTAPATTTVTTAPPPTAPPMPALLAPSSADDGGAVFGTGPSISLRFVARGPCWIGVRAEDGTVTFDETLQAGDERRVDGVATVEVRLGNPTAVDVFVDDAPVQVPAQEGQPFDLTFAPV
jgi:hypothetical protein